jgi:hypothetical protein
LFFPVFPRFFGFSPKVTSSILVLKKHRFFFGLPKNRLTLLTPPFLAGFSAKVCEISSHNSDFLYVFGQMMVNLLCKWLVYFEKLLFTLFQLSVLVNKYQGWIYRGGGGVTGVHTPVGLGQPGSKGGTKKSNSEIWYNFQGFLFFEVKLKLIIQCPYCRKWHF